MAVLIFLTLLCLALSSPIAGRLPLNPIDPIDFIEVDNPICWPSWEDGADRCYKLFRMTKTWHEALAYCKMIDANLTSVRNNDDIIIIKSLMQTPIFPKPFPRPFPRQPRPNTVWIGGSDAVTEGTWKWSDGTPFDLTFWSSGQPDNLGEEDCMSFGIQGLANDEKCDKKLPFVCARHLEI